MEKEKKDENKLTELQKKYVDIIAERLNIPATGVDVEKIKLHKVSTDDYYCLVYNYTGINHHIPEKEINEQEHEINGIGIWHTYECNL